MFANVLALPSENRHCANARTYLRCNVEQVGVDLATIQHTIEKILLIRRQVEEESESVPAAAICCFGGGVADVVPKSIAHRLLAPALGIAGRGRVICWEDKLDRLFAEFAFHKLDLVIADRPLPSGLGVKGYSHSLGRTPIAFYAVPGLAARYQEGFPQSLNGAHMLIPSDGSTMRVALTRWFSEHQIKPPIVGEFDHTALMKAFGKAGAGIFPGPAILSDEIREQYAAEIIGRADSVAERHYAISVERKLTHPAVVAISEAAKANLFVGDRAAS